MYQLTYHDFNFQICKSAAIDLIWVIEPSMLLKRRMSVLHWLGSLSFNGQVTKSVVPVLLQLN